jgi:glycosyltransferase involved in cell wall biosynthesis
MKVLIVSNSANSLWYFRRGHVKSLHSSSEVLIIAINDVTDTTRKEELSACSKCIYLVDSKLQLFVKTLSLAHKSETILSYSLLAGVIGGLAGLIYRVPRRVVLFSGLGYLNYVPKPTLLSRLISTLLSSNNAAIFVNNEDGLKLRNEYKLHFSEQLIVLGEGLDLKPSTEKISINMVGIYAGRLHPQKCVDVLVDSFAKQSNLKKLILVGFTQQQLFEFYNRDFDITNVECVGRVDDIFPYMGQSRYAIMPSKSGEGFPTFLMEAMVNGRICISTDTYGNIDAMDGGNNGYLIKHDYFRNSSRDYIGAVTAMKGVLESLGRDLNGEQKYISNAKTFMEKNCERELIAGKIARYVVAKN